MKKRILSILITVVMLIGMLPITAFAADSVSRMPGARVETNTSGDVFLGGNYIEMGISKRGSFGTYASPQTSGWHKQSGLSGRGWHCSHIRRMENSPKLKHHSFLISLKHRIYMNPRHSGLA